MMAIKVTLALMPGTRTTSCLRALAESTDSAPWLGLGLSFPVRRKQTLIVEGTVETRHSLRGRSVNHAVRTWAKQLVDTVPGIESITRIEIFRESDGTFYEDSAIEDIRPNPLSALARVAL
jgi:hypothetical protein